MFMVHILHISQLIASFSEPGGGLLLHAALVCRGENGFLLMGGSGSGKTTASRRIPSPWRSCCDDYTLVLRDPEGKYWAHPWPTWSRFFQSGPGGSWPAGTAIRLRAIFFLQPAAVDEWSEAIPHQPTVKILEAVEQATWSTTLSLKKSLRRTIRLRRLENAIHLARQVPAFQLKLTLHGKYWEIMENALASKKR
jgi:SynChlorMet cassette protein ScmC